MNQVWTLAGRRGLVLVWVFAAVGVFGAVGLVVVDSPLTGLVRTVWALVLLAVCVAAAFKVASARTVSVDGAETWTGADLEALRAASGCFGAPPLGDRVRIADIPAG